MKKILVIWAGLGLLSIAVASCDDLRGPGGGDANQWVEVNFTVNKQSPSALVNGLAVTGTGQIGTSLIIVVPEGTTPTPYFEQLAASDVLAQALLDIGTSSVSLSVPLGVSVQLFEYTFNDSLTLDELQADLPVAGTPNVSNAFTMDAGVTELSLLLNLQTATINETFDADLTDINWERMDADAIVAGGVLSMSASAAFDSTLSATEQRFGASTILQTNRNLQLANQRIAGTIRVDSFGTADNPVSVDAAQSRIVAGLYYQPRVERGTVRTGLTGVRIMFMGRTGGTPIFIFNVFTCLNDTCASVGAGDLEIVASLPYAFTYGGSPTADIPFEVEYKGSGIFEGTFSGEKLTLNLPGLGGSTFNENDFLYARLQTQGMFMQDSGDTAAITSVFDDLVAGNGPVDGIAVTPTGGVLVNEVGTTDTFNVVLTSAPNADVTIALSNSDTTEATISTSSLTFTSVNWSVPQTVTVTGVDDFVADGNATVTITTAAAVSTDVDYNGLDAPDVAVTVVDNDTPGITPSVGTITTSETPASAAFTIVLSSQPLANVTVSLSSSDTTEGTVSPASLTFSAANWSTPQGVTVTGVDDALNDGSIAYSITATGSSTDTDYNGLTTTVTGTNLDNDSIIVDAATGNDANAGTDSLPVKTITQGLTLTGGLITGVLVNPGTYDAALGEAFPIVVPAGVSLIGDEAGKGVGTTIDAAGAATTVVDGSSGSVIAGFGLANSTSSRFSPSSAGVELRNSSILGTSGIGIFISGGIGGHRIIGNLIKNNTSGIGLAFVGGVPASLTLLQGNQFIGNSIGVEFDVTAGDLGGGAAGSTGGNYLCGNSRNDLWTTGGQSISATNNFWDASPPALGGDGGGVDINNSGGTTTVNVTGSATSSPSPCP